MQTQERPVDNNTYNLLQTLTSKLEAIEAYQTYLKDSDSRSRPLFEQCLQADRKAVQDILSVVREVIGQRETAGIR
jgi:hypothetical protein